MSDLLKCSYTFPLTLNVLRKFNLPNIAFQRYILQRWIKFRNREYFRRAYQNLKLTSLIFAKDKPYLLKHPPFPALQEAPCRHLLFEHTSTGHSLRASHALQSASPLQQRQLQLAPVYTCLWTRDCGCEAAEPALQASECHACNGVNIFTFSTSPFWINSRKSETPRSLIKCALFIVRSYKGQWRLFCFSDSEKYTFPF